ncbi:TetR/AcrR family transcriptional regulator [Micromonospora cathayae]|uniref:TetR/AcrR family transcriptional regulator n=1 Tax=Micromonospora cathayae TaxID=3028804 RepID=A0ABY7ZNK0_9ACTN|nr:TetR/AcrR family transcriptional regulator [Micromonospora sp. HUAS 3]WDZ83549.1 TetR/AcrR family transcriptional regulator [Micromonospora sp. HUAS 3]
MTHPTEHRLRADARRNRDQIIAAARTVFVTAGTDVPMEEIARRAGVGVGTLYRRFPDRGALVRAVARETLAAVQRDARTAVAEEPTAWAAFARLVTGCPGVRLTVRLAARSGPSWTAAQEDPEVARLRSECLALLDEIVHAAQAEGTLRPDVDAADVARLLALLFREDPGDSGVVSERIVGLVLDGLRAGPVSGSAADAGRSSRWSGWAPPAGRSARTPR